MSGRRSKASGSRLKGTTERPPTDSLAEAAQLQQRAERRRGLEAVRAYENATAAYRQILAGSEAASSTEKKSKATFGLAACLTNAADALLTGVQSNSETDLREAESSARSAAQGMLQEAITLYKQVKDENGNVSSDALVDCGNAMAALGELSEPDTALRLLHEATHAYRLSLGHAEDAGVCSNLGDVLVSAGDHLADKGDVEQAKQVYGDAMSQYDKACTLSNSEEGDDLPSLLHNWGIGLQSAGSKLKEISFMKEALMRLQSAKELGHSDVMVLNALGDTYLALAELLSDQREKLEAIKAAKSEGFQAALSIDRRQPDALIGLAEAEMLLGRGAAGDEARAHFGESLKWYNLALDRQHLLGTWSDRCEIRYNQACAASLAGDLQVAQSLLQGILERGQATIAEIMDDPDFTALHGSQLWQTLQNAPAK